MENQELLKSLAETFLSYRHLDEGYFKILREIKRLEYKGIYIDINDVQSIAYGLEGE